VENWAKFRQSF
jgi:hypothetical protein